MASKTTTLDLLNQDYPTKSIDQNQSQLINMYLEPDKSKGKYQIIACPMPGLTSFCNTGQGSVRALFEQNEILYAVAGNKFYSIISNGTKTELGTLNTSSGFAKIVSISGASDSNNQLLIIDGTNGYLYNIGTSTATFPIADADFPQTAGDITSQDDYFFAMDNNSIVFNLSQVADGTTWAALDFASKTGFADRLVAITSNQRKIWLLGSKTTEVWFNSGNVDFPFERIPDVFIHTGCAAKRSVVTCGEYLMFLSKASNGGYKVIQMQGYTPVPIGSPSTDYQISQLTTKSDAIGYCYLSEGHEFFELTFPTDGKTFTYDVTSSVWLNRQSYISSAYTRFLGQCAAFCFDKTLIGDYNSGIIYQQTNTIHTENGTSIQRLIETPPISFTGKRIFISRLQIDVETNVGSSKTFLLEKSVDGGRTWSTVKTFTIGTEPNTRLYAHNVGSSRQFVFRISTTMNAKFIVLGFIVDVELGIH